MAKRSPLPARELADVLVAFPHWRQSILSDADDCMLSTLWRLEEMAGHRTIADQASSWDTAEAARGRLFHAYAAEVLRTLWRTGQVSMPVAEALQVLYEVCAQRDVADEDVTYLPARERRLLRIAALALVYDFQTRESRPFNMANMIDVERRLWASVEYPDPAGGVIERKLTGKPDAVIADPGEVPGVVVLDWKTTPKAPPAQDDADDVDGRGLSYEGYFQQRNYSELLWSTSPSVERVTLREFYVLEGVARTATLYRSKHREQVRAELSNLVELLDRAVSAGSRSKLWKPTPGRHCGFCPRPTACPIEADVRAFAGGKHSHGIATAADAERFAAEYVLAGQVKNALHEALKGYHEQTGHAIPVKSAKGRYVVRWGTTSGGARRFGVHVPAESDRGVKDPELDHVFEAAAERARAAAERARAAA